MKISEIIETIFAFKNRLPGLILFDCFLSI